jgi:hypothetical protein
MPSLTQGNRRKMQTGNTPAASLARAECAWVMVFVATFLGR